MNIEDLGLSSRVRKQLLEKCSEKELCKALLELDFSFLNDLELDSKVEMQLIRSAYAQKYGFSFSSDLCQSPQVKKIQKEILDSIRKRCVLSSTKKKLLQFLPTQDLEEIKRRQELVSAAKQFFLSLSPEKVGSLRSLLLQEDCIVDGEREIVYLCDEDEVFKAFNEKIPAKFSFFVLGQLFNFRRYQDAPLVRYVYTIESKFVSELEQHENVEAVAFKQDFFAVFPELFVAEFAKKKNFLQAAIDCSKLLGEKDGSLTIEREKVEEVLVLLERIENFSGQEFDLADLEAFLEQCVALFEEKLSAMNINGMELLKLLRSNSSDSVIHKVLMEVELAMREIDEEKAGFVIFSAYPLELKKEKVLLLEKQSATEQAKRRFALFDRFYSGLGGDFSLLRECCAYLEELDFLLALGQSFARHSSPLVTCNRSEKFSFKGLKSRALTENNIAAVPIDYYIDRNQTIVTGANSGGKTTLLNLIVETHLLALMGFFVEGEVSVSFYDEIHYFKKSSGTMGSGAFETTLKSFAQLSAGRAGKRILVLADEIESITEPGAASKIIAATLDWLTRGKNVDVILVSHLGEVLAKECPRARIDGIEAKQLGDNLELVVERNPRIGYLARSTPQLIVERLSKKHEMGIDPEEGYFSYLLEKMKT